MAKKRETMMVASFVLLMVSDLLLFTLLNLAKGSLDWTLLTVCVIKLLMDGLTVVWVKTLKMGSPMIPCIAMMLTSIGLAIQGRLSPAIGLKHFVLILMGMAVYFFVTMAFAKLRCVKNVLWLSYGAMVVLFLLTLLFGKNVNGARNWIVLAGISIQPSEVIKVLFAIFIAAYLSDKKRESSPFSKPLLMGLVFLLLGFFAIQREFGTALVVFCTYIAVLFAFEPKGIHLVTPILLAAFGGFFAALKIPHLMVRIESWLNPWADMAGKGYQITQSLFAIGSGGLFGSGLGRGFPKLIPNVTTDFVFSAIYEEMGFLVSAAILILYFLLVYIAFQTALSIKEKRLKGLAYALGTLIGVQVLVIIAGVTKLMPLTGITLPLISYGGSSMVMTFVMLGLLQALTRIVGGEGAYDE